MGVITNSFSPSQKKKKKKTSPTSQSTIQKPKLTLAYLANIEFTEVGLCKWCLIQRPRGAILWFITSNCVNCLHWLSDSEVSCLKMSRAMAKLESVLWLSHIGEMYTLYVHLEGGGLFVFVSFILYPCNLIFASVTLQTALQHHLPNGYYIHILCEGMDVGMNFVLLWMWFMRGWGFFNGGNWPIWTCYYFL